MLDEKLELALLRKSMSGSAGPCSPELLSCGHRAVRPDRQASGSAVDSTLSDHGSHGERAHTRRSERFGKEAQVIHWPSITGSSVQGVNRGRAWAGLPCHSGGWPSEGLTRRYGKYVVKSAASYFWGSIVCAVQAQIVS